MQPSFNICPRCGQHLASHMAFCGRCGTPLAQTPPVFVPERRRDFWAGKEKMFIALAATLFLLWFGYRLIDHYMTMREMDKGVEAATHVMDGFNRVLATPTPTVTPAAPVKPETPSTDVTKDEGMTCKWSDLGYATEAGAYAVAGLGTVHMEQSTADAIKARGGNPTLKLADGSGAASSAKEYWVVKILTGELP